MSIPNPFPNQSAIGTEDPVGLLVGIKRNFTTAICGPVATADRFGRAGRAYLFDGVNDYLQVGSEPLLTPPKFTVVVTFKLLKLPIGGEVVATQQAGVYAHSENTLVAKKGTYIIQVAHEGGASYCYPKIYIGDWNTVHRGDQIQLNSYYQFALSYTDGNLRLAINGALKFEAAKVPAPASNTEFLVIGNRLSSPYPEFFNGIIDEVRLYDRPLTNEEVTRLYQAGPF